MSTPWTDSFNRTDSMTLFGKDFYRALGIGFLVGTAAMGITVGAKLHAQPTVMTAPAVHP